MRWGVAEFAAAEEMDRFRGYWWAPDGAALLATRVDDTPVQRWWIADPAHPDRPPTEVAYPAAGTPNADVTAWILRLDGARTEVRWDRDDLPVPRRGRRGTTTARSSPCTPATSAASRCAAPTRAPARPRRCGPTATTRGWSGRRARPARLADGRVVVCSDADGRRRLVVGGTPVTPDDLHVRGVAHVGDDRVVFTANPIDDATGTSVWRWTDAGLEQLTADDGVHTAVVGGDTVVVRRVVARRPRARRSRWSAARRSPATVATPLVTPNVHDPPRRRATPGHRAPPPPRRRPTTTASRCCSTPTAARTPSGWCRRASAYLTSQWFADQGFAVVVIDGRGTPGRGAEWERGIHGDLAGPVLEDQVDGLLALAAEDPRLDLSRVAIRGWSFGGYLAALAVLRRPDVFHAAIAGAPVTDWRLYDTFYTERYLGDPDGRRRRATTPARCSPTPPSSSARCCCSTAWPTTTSSAPTPSSSPRPCSPPAARTRCCPSPASPTWPTRRRSPRTCSCSSSHFLREALTSSSAARARRPTRRRAAAPTSRAGQPRARRGPGRI